MRHIMSRCHCSAMERTDSNTTQVIPASDKRSPIWRDFTEKENDPAICYCTVESCTQREVKRGGTNTRNTTNLW